MGDAPVDRFEAAGALSYVATQQVTGSQVRLDAVVWGMALGLERQRALQRGEECDGGGGPAG